MSPELRSKLLKTAQNRPIPIETHGVNNIRLDALIKRTIDTIGQVKSPELQRALNELLDLIREAGNSRTQFDSIRDNIEILWGRLSKLLDGNENFTGITPSSSSVVVASGGGGGGGGGGSTEEDLHFFGYDSVGGQSIANTDTALTIDTNVIEDSPYSHTSDSSEIIIDKSGDYEIEIDAGFEISQAEVIETRIQKDTGAGYSDLPGTKAYQSHGYSGFTEGSVLFADSAGDIAEDNSNLFWDDTKNRLGIGTASPSYDLDINGTLGVTGIATHFDNIVLDDGFGLLATHSYNGSIYLLDLDDGGFTLNTGSGDIILNPVGGGTTIKAWLFEEIVLQYNSKTQLKVDSNTGVTIGNGEALVDYAITFDGETSDGVLTWLEDESQFSFDSAITTPSIDINSTIAIVGTLDDDTFATATNTTLATSESIKAYGDNNFALRGIYNGTIKESFNALVTSDGVTITMSLEQSGGGDLTLQFSDGDTVLDCTPACTITLTAGSDTSPQANYIYIPQSTKVLTKSTSGWPSNEHVKISYFFVPSATHVQSDGTYINQNWNDHVSGTDEQGHLPHITERVRHSGANYFSGIDPNGTDQAAATSYFDDQAGAAAYFKASSGVIYQMHRHATPAIDTSGADDIHAVNWNGDAYHEFSDLFDITADSTGTTLSNKYFNVFFFSVGNKSGEYAPVMCKLPGGSYVTQTNAENDVDGFDDLTMPREFGLDSSTGVPICRMTLKWNGGLSTLTHASTLDLRTQSVSGGSGGSGGSITDFADNQFSVFDESDTTKILNLDVGTLVTTGKTRTLQIPDQDGVIALLSDVSGFTEGSVLFADPSGNITEDNANFFWDDTNNGLGIGTASPTASSLSLGAGVDLILSSTSVLTVGGSVDYDIATDTYGLYFQNTTAAQQTQVLFYSQDGDATDDVKLYLYGKGTPDSLLNGENLGVGYDAGNTRMEVSTEKFGSGTLRDLALFTGSNTSQLVLQTDGDISTSGTLFFNDNEGITLGTDDDGEIYFDGSDIVIKETNFGSILLETTSGLIVLNHNSGDSTVIQENGTTILTADSANVDITGTLGVSSNLTVGNGSIGVDYTITINGDTNDGVIKFLEGENEFELNTGLVIGDGSAVDYTLKFKGASNTGTITFDESDDELDFDMHCNFLSTVVATGLITANSGINMADNNITNANIIGDGLTAMTFTSSTSFGLTVLGTTNDLLIEDNSNVSLPNMNTEALKFVDAGSTSATEQDWVEVTVGGVTGYIRVFAAK